MTPIRIFTDEDVYGPLASRLRALGFDAISTPEAGRLGQDDPSQPAWAAGEGRALMTFNVSDFARLHYDWQSRGIGHAGRIVSRQGPLGEILRRLAHLGQALGGEGMRDRLEYLGNWPPA